MKSLKEFIIENIINESFKTDVLREIDKQCKSEKMPFNKLMRHYHVNFNTVTDDNIEIIKIGRNIENIYNEYFDKENEENIFIFGKNTDKNMWMFMRIPDGNLYSLINYQTARDLDISTMHGDIGQRMTKWSRQYRDTRSGYDKVDRNLNLSKSDIKDVLKAVNEIYIIRFDSIENKRIERSNARSGATALMLDLDLRYKNLNKYDELSFKKMQENGWNNYKQELEDFISIVQKFLKDKKIKSKPISKTVRDYIDSLKYRIDEFEKEESRYNYDRLKETLNRFKSNYNKLQKEI